MTRLILLAALTGLLLPYHAMAQPTVTSNALVTLGEAESTQQLQVSPSDFDPGNTGANQTWDYSAIAEDINECFYEALDASLSEFADSFPNSNVYFICISEDQNGEEVENHTFYMQDGNSLFLEGNVSLSISDPDFDTIFLIYSDLQKVMEFPYTLGSNYSDDYAGRLITITGDQTILVDLDGTITSSADAYGQIKTKAGTFENALRVNREEVTSNTLPAFPLPTTNEVSRYTWMSPSENYLIFNMERTVSKDFLGNTVATTYSGLYKKGEPVIASNSSAEIDVHHINYYPNPTKDIVHLQLQMDYQGLVRVELMDISGSLLDHVQMQVAANQRVVSNFDLRTHPKGTYIAVFKTADGQVVSSIPIVRK